MEPGCTPETNNRIYSLQIQHAKNVFEAVILHPEKKVKFKAMYKDKE